jgi:hypothetical protein
MGGGRLRAQRKVPQVAPSDRAEAGPEAAPADVRRLLNPDSAAYAGRLGKLVLSTSRSADDFLTKGVAPSRDR